MNCTNEIISLLKLQFDNNFSTEMASKICSVYLYGSNAEGFLQGNGIVSEEFDFLFVFKDKRSERKSDIDEDLLRPLGESIKIQNKSGVVIFNGDNPVENKSGSFIFDFIADNLPSVLEAHPSSIVTSNSAKILLWGTDCYEQLKGLTLTDKALLKLVLQKRSYLKRVFGNRNDAYSIRAFIKGILFSLEQVLKHHSTKESTFEHLRERMRNYNLLLHGLANAHIHEDCRDEVLKDLDALIKSLEDRVSHTMLYQNAFKGMFDYEMLAQTLIKTGIFNEEFLFVDVPCGRGQLLEVFKKRGMENIIGLDRDLSQVKFATQTLGEGYVFCEDVFRLEKYLSDSRGYTIHSGYCFLNVFSQENQHKLIRAFCANQKVAKVVFEIQNWDYFKFWYPAGVVTNGKTADGRIFSSETLKIDMFKKQVRFTFEDGFSSIQNLFSVDLYEVEKLAFELGFSFNLVPCDYRNSKNDMPSHQLIVLEKIC